MPIHILRNKATSTQLEEMQSTLKSYVKLAVDIRQGVLAGGGEMHADCEGALLEDGSQQNDVWGADWDPIAEEVGFISLINIRPDRGNYSMHIDDADIRNQVERIVRRFFGAGS